MTLNDLKYRVHHRVLPNWWACLNVLIIQGFQGSNKLNNKNKIEKPFSFNFIFLADLLMIRTVQFLMLVKIRK